MKTIKKSQKGKKVIHKRKSIETGDIGKSASIRKTRPNEELPEADLPSNETIVQIIAAQGMDDVTIEFMFNLGKGRLDYWRKVYPGFKNAIETGRSMADVNVILALYKKATGYAYVESSVYGKWPNQEVIETTKHMQPDTKAIELWNKERKEGVEQQSRLNESAMAGGIRDATKQELINSIMALIPPIDGWPEEDD